MEKLCSSSRAGKQGWGGECYTFSWDELRSYKHSLTPSPSLLVVVVHGGANKHQICPGPAAQPGPLYYSLTVPYTSLPPPFTTPLPLLYLSLIFTQWSLTLKKFVLFFIKLGSNTWEESSSTQFKSGFSNISVC